MEHKLILATMDFDQLYAADLTRVENAINQWLPAADTPPTDLHKAMRYCLEAGGKRLRPILLLASSRLFPQRADPLPAAVAIEYLHTYTLIHDDLPAMDNSPLRRGRPAAHIAFSEANAILTGDALLTEAFLLLSKAYTPQPDIACKLIEILADAAGSRKLIGGQAVDTAEEGNAVDAATLDFIHHNKTAALITAALLMGLTCSDAPPHIHQILSDIGRDLGLCFQIVDDILDATADSSTLGKTTGADAAALKNTYVRLHGLEASRQKVADLTNTALQNCRSIPADTSFLQNLFQSLQHRIK